MGIDEQFQGTYPRYPFCRRTGDALTKSTRTDYMTYGEGLRLALRYRWLHDDGWVFFVWNSGLLS